MRPEKKVHRMIFIAVYSEFEEFVCHIRHHMGAPGGFYIYIYIYITRRELCVLYYISLSLDHAKT